MSYKVNVEKVKDIAKKQGVSMKYLCDLFGKDRMWLANVRRGNAKITDEQVSVIANALGTTVEYLTDQTDDPSPKEKDPIQALDEVESAVIEILRGMTRDERIEVLDYLRGKE
jgi:transcriptional regulator with XRE-family HTH domain